MPFKRTFTLISLTVAVIFVGFMLQAINLYRKSAGAHAYIARTNSIINCLEQTRAGVGCMQTEAAKGPAAQVASDNRVLGTLDSLRTLMRNDAEDMKDLAGLRQLVSQKIRLLHEAQDSKAALNALDDHISTVTTDMLKQEQAELLRRGEQFQFYSKGRLTFSLLGYGLLSIISHYRPAATLSQPYTPHSRRGDCPPRRSPLYRTR